MNCVDASVAAKWVLPEEYSVQALALVDHMIELDDWIVAPPLLSFEVTNILRQRMRRRGMPLAEAEQALASFATFPVTLIASDELHRHALTLSDAYGLPASYDAHYLALAQMLQCELWTDDRRLLHELQNEFQFVRWIGDYSDREGQDEWTSVTTNRPDH